MGVTVRALLPLDEGTVADCLSALLFGGTLFDDVLSVMEDALFTGDGPPDEQETTSMTGGDALGA